MSRKIYFNISLVSLLVVLFFIIFSLDKPLLGNHESPKLAIMEYGKTNPQAVPQEKKLVLSVELQAEQFQKEKPFIVTLKILNQSDQKLELKYSITMNLDQVEPNGDIRSPNNFWSLPWVVLSQQTNKDKNEFINPGQSIYRKVDITKSYWAKSTSSVLPYKSLFEVVASNKYQLYCTIEIDDSAKDKGTRITIESNKMNVIIE